MTYASFFFPSLNCNSDAFVNKSYPNYKFEYRADKEREATDSKCLFDDMKSALDIRLKELGISLDNKEL